MYLFAFLKVANLFLHKVVTAIEIACDQLSRRWKSTWGTNENFGAKCLVVLQSLNFFPVNPQALL